MRVTSILLAMAALSAPPARSAGRPPLTIRVFAYVRVPAATLRALTARGEEIFREAGFQTRWIACTPARGDCGDLLDGDLLLKVVRRPWAANPLPSAFGAVLRDAHTAYFGWIFYEPVEDAAKVNRTPASVLLAHVIAHEAAHLLGLTHAERGIMHCQFTAAEIQASDSGGLRFTAEQGAELRAAAIARQNRSIASTTFRPNPQP